MDTPVRQRIRKTLEKNRMYHNQMYPEPVDFPMIETYHRKIGGQIERFGNDGHYPVGNPQSVASYPLLPDLKPIGLPKPKQIGKGRSGGSCCYEEQYCGGVKSGGKRKTLLVRNLEQLGEYIKPIGKPLVELAQKTIKKKIDKIDGKKKINELEVKNGGKMSGGSKKERGMLVSKLMKEKGMTLPEASRYIKEKGLM